MIHDTILEILPAHPASEQKPAMRVRPFFILINWPSLIGPYVLHFKQNPSTVAMCIGCSCGEHFLVASLRQMELFLIVRK